MICSGSQLNAFIPITQSDKHAVGSILSLQAHFIQLSPKGLELADGPASFEYRSAEDWVFMEPVNQQPVIHIIGAGHVGLALSQLMNFLGFYIKLYDDRQELNTMDANSFVQEKHIVDYETIGSQLIGSEADFVVIMTVGYRTDKLVLKQLIKKPLAYLGLLGSDYKIKTLLEEMKAEGFADNELQKIFTPVGINIFSKTTREIAVSIAAEIIREKNKDLPTGRSADL